MANYKQDHQHFYIMKIWINRIFYDPVYWFESHQF